MIMAQIENNMVVNVLVIMPGQEEEFPDCVCIDNRPVGIGDEYRDGKFYRDGEEIKTDAEILAELMAQPDSGAEAMAILKGEEVATDGAE